VAKSAGLKNGNPLAFAAIGSLLTSPIVDLDQSLHSIERSLEVAIGVRRCGLARAVIDEVCSRAKKFDVAILDVNLRKLRVPEKLSELRCRLYSRPVTFRRPLRATLGRQASSG
jgi:hypothetical protein